MTNEVRLQDGSPECGSRTAGGGITFSPKYPTGKLQEIKVGGKPVGELLLGDKVGDTLKVEFIRVEPSERGQHIGERTISEIFKRYPEIKVIVGEAMTDDMGYWDKIGAKTQDGWFRIYRS